MLPFKFSFIETNNTFLWLVEHIFDPIFILDIFFTFFVPYTHKGRFIVSHQKIALHYITSVMFWVDVISIVPFDLIFSFESNYSVLIKVLKLPRLYRVVRIVLTPA